MIIGMGTDLLDMRRIEKLMARYEDRFAERYFTAIEQSLAESRREAGRHIDTYAKRFAAKEACAKALGRGIDDGIYMKDIGVVNNAAGAPELVLTGGALARLNEITPKGKTAVLHLSITDEPPLAQAHVIIEAR